MKKKLITVKDFAEKMEVSKRKVKNAFSEEGAEAAAAIRDLIDELENAEIEIDERELASRIEEVIRAFNGRADEEVPANVANALAAKFAEMQSAMPVSDKLTPAIKNQVSAAILKARGKDEIENAVQAVLLKNGISGLEFNEAVDYAISEGWGENNRLFNALRKTPFAKFFYSEQDVIDTGVQAHGWAKTSNAAKIVQTVNALKKSIQTQYIYKRQQVALEDLDDMREDNGETTFLRWLNEELDRQIINTIVAVMTGALVPGSTTDITTIEPLMGSGTDDAFRSAVTVAAADVASLTIVDMRKVSDAVPNPYGKSKWMLINQETLTSISKFTFADGGTPTFHTLDTLKGLLGVDEVYVTSLAATPIVFLPDGYWVKEKNAISVVYPMWDYNVMNYQKERNLGSAVHDLKSVAFPKFA